MQSASTATVLAVPPDADNPTALSDCDPVCSEKAVLRVTPPRLSSIKLQDMPGRVGKRLKSLDVNGDGVIDADELTRAIDSLLDSETSVKYWKWFVAVFVAFFFVISGIMAGILYGFVVASQDVQVHNNFLVAKGGNRVSPLVTSPYHWQPVNTADLLQLSQSQLESLAALSVTRGGFNAILQVKSSTMVQAAQPTLILTANDAVLVVSDTGLEVTWTNQALAHAVDNMLLPTDSTVQTASSANRWLHVTCSGTQCGYSANSAGFSSCIDC